MEWITILAIGTAYVIVFVLIAIGRHWEWTGFGPSVPSKPEGVEVRGAKTLWDWLVVLIGPLAGRRWAAGLEQANPPPRTSQPSFLHQKGGRYFASDLYRRPRSS